MRAILDWEVGGVPDYPEDVNVDELMSLPDAGALVGLDPSALRRRIRAQRLKYKKIGRSYATTLRWIAQSEEPGHMGRPPKRLPDHLRPAGQ
jgi:hypothetical protein